MEKQQTSNEYGISQELLVVSILVNYGTVSIPYGNSARYDCILDIDNHYYRIQIKSLNMLDEDTIYIPMSNARLAGNNGKVTKEYTSEDVDFIAICFNQKVYLFNPDLSKHGYTVRINKPTQYNQHWIEDYEISKVLDIQLKSWVALKEETRLLNNPTGKQQKYKCIDCGAPVWNFNSRCITCAREIQSAGGHKPSREILKELIKKTSFTAIGRQYGVTDNAVRKWCKTYELPSKSSEIKEIIKRGDWDSI